VAQVALVYVIDIPYHADKKYSYFIPMDIRGEVIPGSLVEIPFGKGNRKMTGIVVECQAIEPDEKMKPITAVFGDGPILSNEMIGLCEFIKSYTLCTFGDAVRAVVPSSAMSKVISYYRIIPENERVSGISYESAMDSIGDRGRLVYALAAQKGKFTYQMIQAEFDFDCVNVIASLIKKGLCEKYTEIKGSASVKTKIFISLSGATERYIDEDPSYFEEVLSHIRGANQKKILTALRDFGTTESGTLLDELGITTTAGKSAIEALVSRGLVERQIEDDFRNPFTVENLLADSEMITEKPILSEEQMMARNTIVGLYESGKPCAALLHGVTGSGKTNVILSAIDRVLEDGRGVIMLVPEIALTPQTVGIFVRRYGDNIAVLHSALSAGERYDAWRRIRDGYANVVIGTRSAIFAPLRDIGLIVIDEEHEYTYKSDTNPKYHAHDIARRRCRDHNAMMLLSSATPSVSSYYKAKNGTYTLVELKNRYGSATLPKIHIYDMRGEVAVGNLSPVGSLLHAKLMENKELGNQSILFLNRRGYNNYVSCRSCGKSIKCPHCTVTLTYHATRKKTALVGEEEYERFRRENGYLVCHMCGYRSRVPEKCPDCDKDHFLFMGCGTQKAEDDIADLIPDLRVLRMDLDTTRAKHSHEDLLSKFRRGEADVLLGTQMVTKGHDFPKVATVGVLNADSSLFLDDYRAGERTFAMLTQVIGRAGRADVPGCAIIQTYNPDNEVLRMAAEQDYVKFYEGEIQMRKALCFPPFCDIAVITVSGSDEAHLGLVTTRMYERIIQHTREEFSDVPLVLYGPFEAPVYRVRNMCRMRFVLKCRLNTRTRNLISELMSEFGKYTPGENKSGAVSSKTNRRVTISVDLNPSTV